MKLNGVLPPAVGGRRAALGSGSPVARSWIDRAGFGGGECGHERARVSADIAAGVIEKAPRPFGETPTEPASSAGKPQRGHDRSA